MSSDWYRNTTWSEEIEQAFNDKFHRARDKAQYLRIQACILACSHPLIALRLLDRYFELNDQFDRAQTYVDRATALLALGRIDDARSAYEAALEQEEKIPNAQTRAYLDLPYIIAVHRLREHYQRAHALLSLNKSRLMFPVDHFCWHASHALLAADTDDRNSAHRHAILTLEAAGVDHSGLRHHATVGIVTSDYQDTIKVLKSICAN